MCLNDGWMDVDGPVVDNPLARALCLEEELAPLVAGRRGVLRRLVTLLAELAGEVDRSGQRSDRLNVDDGR